MTAIRILDRRSPAPREPGSSPERLVHLSDFLIPASLVLWAVGVSRTRVPAVQPYGLMTSLPLVYYAGIALLVVSAVMELRRTKLSEWRLSVHGVVLVVMLFATAPLVYSEGRYAWLYKTIGVVQYINAHGQLNDQIDIYQNWPGFFALASWFGKVAGLTNPLAYAKWAQLVFELSALPLLYLIYDSLALPARQRWVAIFLYSSSNWIGQDYYSPQALGTLLSLGIMALALRWLYVDRASAKPTGDEASAGRWRSWTFPTEHGRRYSILIIGVIALIYFVLSMTHQLSPYMLVVQLGALSVAGRLRPRWLPVALAAIAVGYLIPRYGFVNSHFGLLKSLGSFFSNIRPPSLAGTATSPSEKLIARCAEALSLGMWCLALAGAWLHRRSQQATISLLVLAFSPILLLALQAYGQEGILRVYLFSLPWTVALAASALLPSPAVTGAGSHRSKQQAPSTGAVRVLIALAGVLALFFPSFFGDDGYNVMTSAEVASVTSFSEEAPAGTIYFAADNAPFQDTSRYDLFDLTPIFGPEGLVRKGPVKPDIATTILDNALRNTPRNEPDYVVITPSMVNYARDYVQTPANAFTVLERSLAQSPLWTLVLHQDGTYIYELPPRIQPVLNNLHQAQYKN